MPVTTPHPLYETYQARWRRIRDAADTERMRKDANRYLRELVDHASNQQRRRDYIDGAYYINVTGRTRDGLTGAAFLKSPTVNLPAQLEYLQENADGAGLSLEQLSKAAVSDTLETGRFGVLVDHPPAPADNPSAEQMVGLAATLKTYPAENIINWRYDGSSGIRVLTLVVLKEVDDKEIDEFNVETVDRYRCLKLVGGVYVQQVYDENGRELGELTVPRQANGTTWQRIPFHFIGADDNSPEPSASPLQDLADINIAQFRNIADREENLHLVGQGTLFVSSDADYSQFEKANPDGIQMGSRTGHYLGRGGDAKLLQLKPADALTEAIKQKTDEMVSVGARLITRGDSVKTAEQSRAETSSEHSVLSTLVGNVSEAIEAAIEDAARFMLGEPPADSVEYRLNDNFWSESVNPQILMALIQNADRGDIAQADLRQYLRDTGIVNPERTDEQIDADLAATSPV